MTAGGLGAGLVAFLGATLVSGVDLVLEAVGLRGKLDGAHLVITGEGALDFQTVYGKAPIGVSRLARGRRIPVLALAGTLGRGLPVAIPRGRRRRHAHCARPYVYG